MPRIAISYRRADSQAITGRIFDRLVAHYGRDNVFRDIDNIPLGVDFRSHVASVLADSDIILVVVGPRWLGARGGQSRVAEPTDPVRIEVDAALRRGVPVIPILIDRATMPKVEQLPDEIKDFAYRNGLRVDSGQDFDSHMDRLIRAMDGLLAPTPSPQGAAGAADIAVPALPAPTTSAAEPPRPPRRRRQSAAPLDLVAATAEPARPATTVLPPAPAPPPVMPFAPAAPPQVAATPTPTRRRWARFGRFVFGYFAGSAAGLINVASTLMGADAITGVWSLSEQQLDEILGVRAALGVVFIAVERHFRRVPGGYWAGAALFGAATSVIGWIIAFSSPYTPALAPLLAAPAIDALWGLVLAVLVRLFLGAPRRNGGDVSLSGLGGGEQNP